MKKILILYFSGVGATKKIAELIHSQLSRNCKADIFSIECKDTPTIDNYNALVIGTPTYHAAPARAVMNYIEALPPLAKEMPAFIYNTRGLCSLNTNRLAAKGLHRKNIVTVMDRAYRGPASDGSLIAPFINRFFEFEKGIESKIDRDCSEFLRLLENGEVQGYTPRFQFGSIINAPNKLAGQLITLKIHLHKDKCVKCGKCIEHCPYTILSKDKNDYPQFAPKGTAAQPGCENCYRCIHHCPKTALSLSKRKTPKKILHY